MRTGLPPADLGDLLTSRLSCYIWQRYVGVEPPGRDEGEIGVRVAGVVRAWDYADDLEEFGAS